MSLYRLALQKLPRPLLIRLSYGFSIVAPLIYKGNAVECPVCKNHFRKFLSYGSNQALRDNVLCPSCLSLERHRLLWLFLHAKTNFFTDSLRVLHIAPEQCFYERFKRLKNIDYVTGDLVSPLADYHFDLHHIPFEANTFDVVICNHVLEHVEDSHQCMKELYRVMKSGGWGIMQVPVDYNREDTYEDPSILSEADREKHFWQKDHVRLFGRNYGDKLQEAGFSVVEDRFVLDMKKEERDRYRLQKEEIIYLAQKGNPTK